MGELDYAQETIRDFRNNFGEGHYHFARHASFLVGFTPDMLYQLWANFNQYQDEVKKEWVAAPLWAVSDLLLSPLCEKVSADVFEMPNLIRAHLLEKLPEVRKNEIAHFLSEYLEKNLSKIRQSTLYQTLYWNTLVTIAPQQAFEELSDQLSTAVSQRQEGEVSRFRNLLEAFAHQDKGLNKAEDSNFNKLLHYAKAMKAAFLDYPKEIFNKELEKSGATISFKRTEKDTGISLPILKEVVNAVNLPHKSDKAETVKKKSTPPIFMFVSLNNEKIEENYQEEISLIERILGRAIQQGNIQLKKQLNEEGLKGLLTRISETLINPTVFHLFGKAEQSSLEGTLPKNLTTFFDNTNQLKLLFLNDTSFSSQLNTFFQELAPKSFKKFFPNGMPAVVIRQEAISDQEAKLFAGSFYQGLSYGQSIGEAFSYATSVRNIRTSKLFSDGLSSFNEEIPNEAYKLLHSDTRALEWKIPTSNKKDIHALLVGLEQYHPDAKINPRHGSIGDVNQLENSLVKFAEQNRMTTEITKLTDENATKEHVLDELDRIFKDALADDQVFLLFVGHSEETPDGKSSIVLYDSHLNGNLFAHEVESFIKGAIQKPYVFLLLDSGQDWLDCKDEKQVFISGRHNDKDSLSNTSESFSTYFASLLEEENEGTYRRYFQRMVKHFKDQKRVQLYSHPRASFRSVLKKNDPIRDLKYWLQATAFEDRNKAVEAFKDLPQTYTDQQLIDALRLEKERKEKELQPIFLLVFANIRGELPGLLEEKKVLEQLFKEATRNRKAELVILNNPFSYEVRYYFCAPETRNRIHLFHFAGRIVSDALILENDQLELWTILQWLDFQENIKLSFFNGCNSEYIATCFGQLGAKTTIGTTGKVNDIECMSAATIFYKNWLQGLEKTADSFAKTFEPNSEVYGLDHSSNIHRGPSFSSENDASPFKNFQFYTYPWAKDLQQKTVFDYPIKEDIYEENDQLSWKKGKRIFAIIIGINAYPRNPLYGCINDAVDIHAFLSQLTDVNDEYTSYHPYFLLAPHSEDEVYLRKNGIVDYIPPTYENVIKAFQHFTEANAEREDVCFFYYSGHSSFMAGNFSNMEATIICVDSRTPGRKDLIESNFIYLLWKATKEKYTYEDKAGIHILLIMECGGGGLNPRRDFFRNPRKLEETRQSKKDFSKKLAPPTHLIPVLEDYLGYKEIEGASESGKQLAEALKTWYSTRYVLLRGANSYESAKETLLEDRSNGVFTYSLLKTLRNGGTQLSYKELIERVKVMVRNRVNGQTPSIYCSAEEDEHLTFLANSMREPVTEYPVSYDFVEGVWKLHAGVNAGIVVSTAFGKTTVSVWRKGNEEKILETEVISVGSAESILDGSRFSSSDQAQEDWVAKITYMNVSTIKVYIDETVLHEASRELLDVDRPWNATCYYEFVNRITDAEYVVYYVEGEYVIAKKNSNIPIFRRTSNATVFLTALQSVGHWRFILGMTNPETSIVFDDLKLDVEVIEGVQLRLDNLNTVTAIRKVENPSKIRVSYKGDKDNPEKMLQPGLRVGIRTTNKPYFVSCLYLDSQYGITSNLASKEIRPDNKSTWLTFSYKGIRYSTIPLSFDENYHQLGIYEITDYLKIFISTEEFPVKNWEADELLLDSSLSEITRAGKSHRGSGLEEEEEWDEVSDWTSFTIPVRIKREMRSAENIKSANENEGLTEDFDDNTEDITTR